MLSKLIFDLVSMLVCYI